MERIEAPREMQLEQLRVGDRVRVHLRGDDSDQIVTLAGVYRRTQVQRGTIRVLVDLYSIGHVWLDGSELARIDRLDPRPRLVSGGWLRPGMRIMHPGALDEESYAVPRVVVKAELAEYDTVAVTMAGNESDDPDVWGRQAIFYDYS